MSSPFTFSFSSPTRSSVVSLWSALFPFFLFLCLVYHIFTQSQGDMGQITENPSAHKFSFNSLEIQDYQQHSQKITNLTRQVETLQRDVNFLKQTHGTKDTPLNASLPLPSLPSLPSSLNVLCDSVEFPSISSLFVKSSDPKFPQKSMTVRVDNGGDNMANKWFSQISSKSNEMKSEALKSLNSAVCYLISYYPNDLKDLKLSLEYLYKNVLQYHPYIKIFLFIDKDEKSKFPPHSLNPSCGSLANEDLSAPIHCWLPSSISISFVEISLSPSPYFHVETEKDGPAKRWKDFKRSEWAYSNMIRFWAVGIFDVPEVQTLDYWWRMDTDSYVLSPVHVDPFLFMKCSTLAKTSQNPFYYGYLNVMREESPLVENLFRFTYDYALSHNLLSSTVQHSSWFRWPTDWGKASKSSLPMFYNNFEIVDVKFWISEGMKNFTNSVDKSLGIYRYRWGDAVLRWFAMALHGKSENSSLMLQFKYSHGGLNKIITPLPITYPRIKW